MEGERCKSREINRVGAIEEGREGISEGGKEVERERGRGRKR